MTVEQDINRINLRLDTLETRKQLEDSQRKELSITTMLSRDLVDIGLVPCASIRQTSVQAVTEAAWTKIAMDTQVFDFMGSAVDLTNDRIYARRGGIYLVLGQIKFADGDADGSRYASIYVNGVATEGSGEFGGYGSPVASIIRPVALGFVKVNVGDYFELFGFQDRGAGATLNTNVAVPRSFLTVCLIGRGN